MTRKNESITLSISESEKEALAAIAAEHKCIWGEKANISGLVKKIAHGQLSVVAGNSDNEIQRLMQTKEVKRLKELLDNLQ
jgi:3-hydroxyisobutyrate dehydrogenase-like beta-hydroxyacid dehydrogenase